MNLKTINITAVIIAGVTVIYSYGMLVNRVAANENKVKDLDMLRIDARLSVIEANVVSINDKIDEVIKP